MSHDLLERLDHIAHLLMSTTAYHYYSRTILEAKEELSMRPEGVEQERKVVGYMNERGGIMTEKDYWEHTNTPAWKWVIDQHWTPVAPVYAGDFIDRPSPQEERHSGEGPRLPQRQEEKP